MALIPFRPSVEAWRDLVTKMAGDLPVDFLLAAADEESGGNTCSLGIPGVEAGLFQTYHPQDDIYGATFSQLRAGCSGSTLTRELTDAEKMLQVQSGIGLFNDYRNRTRAALAQVGASWPESSTDFWTFVKFIHGLGAAPQLLPVALAYLGHPPQSWDEFRQAVMLMSPSVMPPSLAAFAAAPSHQGLASRMEDVLVNAEKAGKYGGGVLGMIGALPGGTYGPLILLGAAGALFYLLWKD